MENRQNNANKISGIVDRTMEILEFDHSEFYGVDGIVDVFTRDNKILTFGIQNDSGEYDLLESYFVSKGSIGIITTENADEINFISQLVMVIDADATEEIQDKEMMIESVRDEFKEAAEATLDDMLGETYKIAR